MWSWGNNWTFRASFSYLHSCIVTLLISPWGKNVARPFSEIFLPFVYLALLWQLVAWFRHTVMHQIIENLAWKVTSLGFSINTQHLTLFRLDLLVGSDCFASPNGCMECISEFGPKLINASEVFVVFHLEGSIWTLHISDYGGVRWNWGVAISIQ